MVGTWNEGAQDWLPRQGRMKPCWSRGALAVVYITPSSYPENPIIGSNFGHCFIWLGRLVAAGLGRTSPCAWALTRARSAFIHAFQTASAPSGQASGHASFRPSAHEGSEGRNNGREGNRVHNRLAGIPSGRCWDQNTELPRPCEGSAAVAWSCLECVPERGCGHCPHFGLSDRVVCGSDRAGFRMFPGLPQ